MKRSISRLIFAPITLLIAACGRQDNDGPAPSGAIEFNGSGISLTPGDGWKRIDIAAGPGQCPPTLVGKSGIIQVLALPADRSDPEAASAGLRAAFDSDPKSVKDSFVREPFASAGGAQGIRISYGERSEKAGRVTEGRSYHYIIRNGEGRGVVVNFITPAEKDFDEVHEMIRQTLRLH